MPVAVDLGTMAGTADEGIVGRHRTVIAHTKDLAS
jgi:hypothetical protein